jgi:hypothetical protein
MLSMSPNWFRLVKNIAFNNIMFVLMWQAQLHAQNIITGSVSFQSASNHYVKFASTEDININDTLIREGQPCLIVQAKSSTSCVCVAIYNCLPLVGDSVSISIKQNDVPSKEQKAATNQVEIPNPDSTVFKKSLIDSLPTAEPLKLIGSISFSSLAQQTLSSEANRLNLRQTLRFNTNYHLNAFKKDIRMLLNGNYQNYYSNFQSSYPKYGRLNIYQAAFIIPVNAATKLTIGRSFQSNGLSTLGIFDAVRLQLNRPKMSYEAMFGLMPNLQTFGIALNQQLFGVSATHTISKEKINYSLGVGAFLQLNKGKYDRLNFAFQGSANITKLNLYTAGDFDLSPIQSRFNNLFVSANYRLRKGVNLFVSYDTRQAFILWNTYQQNLIDELLDAAVQQGLRLRIQLKVLPSTMLSVYYTHRFSSNLIAMQLVGVQLHQQKWFWKKARFTYSGNLVSYPAWLSIQQTLRFEQQIKSANYSLFYRSQLFDRKNIIDTRFNQSTFGVQWSSALSKSMQFVFSGEYAIQQQQNLIRVYVTAIKKL